MTNHSAVGAEITPSDARWRSALRQVWALLAPFVGLALVLGIFVASEHWFGLEKPFLTPIRVPLLAKQAAIIGVGALGMTLIIIAGGIDLSAGSVLALTSVVLAVTLKQGWSPPVALLATIAIGGAAGAGNGLLITGLRLVPFIVTLGTMLLFRGLAEQISGQTKVNAPAPDWLSTLLDAPDKESWQWVSPGVWIVLALGVLLACTLRYTVFGRYVFALGSNEATARLCGLNVTGLKIAVYTIGGCFMALAGVFDFSDLNGQGSPTAGIGKELEMIAAVVIGGGSLNGGRGSVLGSLVGALTMTVLRSGCVYVGVSDPVQKMVIGGIIVAAVTVDQLLHRGHQA